MKISEILKKIVADQELSAEEKKFLSQYQETNQNDEIAQLKQQISTLTTERDALKVKVDEEENKNLDETQRLQKEVNALKDQISTLTTERDNLQRTATENAFRHGIEELARTHKCNDVDYLFFKAQSHQLDLGNEKKVGEFIDNFKKEAPKFFDADVNNGGGGTPPQNQDGQDGDLQTRIDDLLKKDTLTEKEVAEVIKLQDELNNKPANT